MYSDTQKYSPIPLNTVTEIKELKLLLSIRDIVLMRAVDSLERTKEEGKKLKVRKLDL